MTPLKILIDRQLSVLGITRGELARRLGYMNVAKALRKIDRLCEDGVGQEDLIQRLPDVLEVDRAMVSEALEERHDQLRRAREQEIEDENARWRAAFKPHAIIMTEQTVPSQITICAMAGGHRFRWIDLDTSRPRATFIHQAMRELARRQAARGLNDIPFFGAPTGFIINLSPDQAIRYDLMGEAIELLPEAYRVGRAVMFVRGKPLSSLR